MIMLTQFPKRSRSGDDYQIVDLSAENLSVEQVGSSGCETVFLDLTVVWIGGAALMTGARALVVVCHIFNCRGRQFWIGFVS